MLGSLVWREGCECLDSYFAERKINGQQDTGIFPFSIAKLIYCKMFILFIKLHPPTTGTISMVIAGVQCPPYSSILRDTSRHKSWVMPVQVNCLVHSGRVTHFNIWTPNTARNFIPFGAMPLPSLLLLLLLELSTGRIMEIWSHPEEGEG